MKQPAWKPWQGQYGFSIFGARDSRDPPGAILIGVAVGPIRFPTQAEHGDHEPRPFWGCPCDTPWCQVNKKSWCNFGQSKKTEQRTNKYGLQPFWFAKVDPASTDFTGFYNIYVLLVFFLGVATAIYITTMWLGNWFSFLRSDRMSWMSTTIAPTRSLPTGERSYPVLSRSKNPWKITDCLLLKSNDIPWTSHENPMKILWTSHEHPMKIPWACHEHAIFSSLLYSGTESILDDPYPRQEASAPRYGARCGQRRPPHSQPPWCRHPRRGSPVGSWLWRPPNGCQLRGGHLYYCKTFLGECGVLYITQIRHVFFFQRVVGGKMNFAACI